MNTLISFNKNNNWLNLSLDESLLLEIAKLNWNFINILLFDILFLFLSQTRSYSQLCDHRISEFVFRQIRKQFFLLNYCIIFSRQELSFTTLFNDIENSGQVRRKCIYVLSYRCGWYLLADSILHDYIICICWIFFLWFLTFLLWNNILFFFLNLECEPILFYLLNLWGLCKQ